MAGNRKAFEADLYARTMRMDPSGITTNHYKAAMAQLDDRALDAYVKRLASGEESISVFREHGKENAYLDRNGRLALCKEWGIATHERLWIDDGRNPPYLSNHVYGILRLPVRRQSQILPDKQTMPYTSATVDELTGQAAGASKGSSLSNPEAQILLSYDLKNCLAEFMKLRGGDQVAFRAMNKSIDATGGASIDAIMRLGSEVESTATLRSFLLGMHFNPELSRLNWK